MRATLFERQARHLRRVSGSTELEKTLRKAVKALAQHGIPHWVTEGFAVQERGYPRFTADVDIIVPNVAEAREKLANGGFRKNPGSSMTITDRESKVEIDLLPDGKRVDAGPLPLPMPANVSDQPQILPLDVLISSKLSVGRAQDFADVVQLIKKNFLQHDLAVNAAVRANYEKTWDTAAAEQAAEGLAGEDN